MALYLMITAALFAALQNLFMRRSVDTGGSTNLYVPLQLFVSCLITILLGPVKTGNYAFDPTVVFFGLGIGLLFGVMMWGMGQSLKYGSSGLTFAVINSASILPAVLMALIFGNNFGHPYHWYTGVGATVVVAGIFWSSWSNLSCSNKGKWAVFVSFAIFGFVLLSASLQWRILLENHGGTSRFLPFSLNKEAGEWFTPAIFFVATLFQLPALFKQKKIGFSKETALYGLLGGISNGSSMYFSVIAAAAAVSWQNAVLFPLFSIGVIEFSNLWGKYLYKENLNFAPRALCISGLVLGSVNWPAFFGG